ncbi:hypothetical protein NLG97_g6599 [Lecanicillium saksenae]|uniref:Uncharacterized protein n=1 Tax=Lecanicillium saksenae TaxID=468837 RepID=A0ACC1QPR3_9HYPO|nr:hypothetical protein NLG97_g6599 [Lecanicillium saksenae]
MASADDAGNGSDEHHQLSNEEYTVGWICALTTESVAAQVFLDQKHAPPLYIATHDNNDYTLGRIGRHNVAIAVLPGGEYGTASAASVARDMLHTFPNIRLGLMVGIGGGAPSARHDVRLGDVVVSEPQNGLGGVFQYDFGKHVQDQPFQHTRFLAPPPTVLLTAISGLRADYKIDGHTIQGDIQTRLAERKRLRKEFGRPDAETDRLYQSTVIHPPGEGACPSRCGSNETSLVIRTVRDEDEDDPAIHYGLIASANQLMKDAKLRDQLADEKGILCFEMEAGGLMNHFPCLVIRGICDYSDTHKNKEWQGYAAMTAAAYAKDLLKRISPNKIEAEKKLIDLVENALGDIKKTSEAVTRMDSTQVKGKDKEILDWLTPMPIDYGSQYSNLLKIRQPGTGQWLLDSAQYQTWLGTPKQTLFCPGIPGAGKTILTSIVIESLRSRFDSVQEVGIAYLYCNFQQQQKQQTDNLLASLLQQLAQPLSSLPDSVKSLYESHNNTRTRPSVDDISKTLQSVATMYSRVFIIVDALDECRETDSVRTRLLSEISSLQAKCGVNILATSRPIQDIVQHILKKFDRTVTLEISASDEDVRKYLDGEMSELPNFIRREPALQEEIKSKIMTTISGMFLLAKLYLDSLRGKTSPKAVRTALAELITGSDAYDYAYNDAMERIQGQLKDRTKLAIQVLSWVVNAKRPLTTSELQHALAVEVGEAKLDYDNFPDIEDMVSVCAGLVTADEESGIIRLVHYTTQEYFERTQNHWFPKAQDDITEICVTYLSFNVFGSGSCQTDAEFEERLQINPLYDYAAHNWGHHALKGSICCASVLAFLRDSPKVDASTQALMAIKLSWESAWSQDIPKRVTGLHLAAYFGIHEVVRILLQNWQKIDQRDSRDRTPLSYATEEGHEAIIKLLLATDKVDVDAKDDIGRTPLLYAAENGHEAIVKLLVATDKVDVDAKDDFGRTPLSYAAENGHEAVAKLLLATEKVDVDAKDNRGGSPLLYAAGNGHEAIVELLYARLGF